MVLRVAESIQKSNYHVFPDLIGLKSLQTIQLQTFELELSSRCLKRFAINPYIQFVHHA